MNIIFFDTETTGGEAKDRIIQLGVKSRGVEEPLYNNLYKPEVPITVDSMAVHHIVPEMVDDKPMFTSAEEYSKIKSLFESDDTFAVAHNASFDVSMLAKEGVRPKNVICTLKVARALDSDEKIPRFGLQYLRYFLKLRISGVVPHDAWGDVVVLEHVFERLLKKLVETKGSEEAAVAEMIAISSRPSLMRTIRFGKYNGKKVDEVAKEDRGYLEWLLREKEKTPAEEADWIYTLKVALGLSSLEQAGASQSMSKEASIEVASEDVVAPQAQAETVGFDVMSHFKPASAMTSRAVPTPKKEEELPTINVE
jgi:exodeoxyribonuclease X